MSPTSALIGAGRALGRCGQRDRGWRQPDHVPGAARVGLAGGDREHDEHGRDVPGLLRRDDRAAPRSRRPGWARASARPAQPRRQPRRRVDPAAHDARDRFRRSCRSCCCSRPAARAARPAARATSLSTRAAATRWASRCCRSRLAAVYGAYFGAGMGVIILAVLAVVHRRHARCARTRSSSSMSLASTCAAAILFLFVGTHRLGGHRDHRRRVARRRDPRWCAGLADPGTRAALDRGDVRRAGRRGLSRAIDDAWRTTSSTTPASTTSMPRASRT